MTIIHNNIISCASMGLSTCSYLTSFIGHVDNIERRLMELGTFFTFILLIETNNKK